MTAAQVWIAVWFSVGGLIVGVFFGEVIRKIRGWPINWQAARVAFGVVIMAACVTSVTTVAGRSECQTQTNEEFRAKYAERVAAGNLDREANRAERDANRQLILAILTDPTSDNRAAGERRLRDYVAKLDAVDTKLDEADRQRADNPLPSPTADCDVAPW